MFMYKNIFSVIFIALVSVSCAERYNYGGNKARHVNKASSHAAKDAIHHQKSGDASSTEKQKSKLHHKGGGTRFKFY